MVQHSGYPPIGGSTYIPKIDGKRLGEQHARVWRLMRDGAWRTYAEIAAVTGDPEASISARLRDFRKEEFGGHVVDRRHRGEPKRGLYEYRLVTSRPDVQMAFF